MGFFITHVLCSAGSVDSPDRFYKGSVASYGLDYWGNTCTWSGDSQKGAEHHGCVYVCCACMDICRYGSLFLPYK